MRSHITAGKWKQIRGQIKERWGQITDDDLDRIEGRIERLVGVVEERYGYGQRQARREVEVFLRELEAHPSYIRIAVGAVVGAVIVLLLIVNREDLYKALA